MSFKKGDIVTISNKLEEYIGAGMVLHMDDRQVELKIIDEYGDYERIPEDRLLLGYEEYNNIFVTYCDVLEKADKFGIVKLCIDKTFSMLNRRFSTRYPASLKVSINPGASLKTFDGVIKNMSLRGFMVNSDMDLQLNRHVEVSINLDRRAVLLKARIARKIAYNGSFNYGMHTIDLGYDEKAFLGLIMKELKEKQRMLSKKLLREFKGGI